MALAYLIRPLESDDLRFLQQMIYLAADWRAPAVPTPSAQEAEYLSRYMKSWGRVGDIGYVAQSPSGALLGTCSCRIFSEDAKGYGFVNEMTPEMSLAVLHDHRNLGIGTALLGAVIEEAYALGFTQLSLAVHIDNPAKSIYEKLGFKALHLSGQSWVMVRVASRWNVQ